MRWRSPAGDGPAPRRRPAPRTTGSVHTRPGPGLAGSVPAATSIRIAIHAGEISSLYLPFRSNSLVARIPFAIWSRSWRVTTRQAYAVDYGLPSSSLLGSTLYLNRRVQQPRIGTILSPSHRRSYPPFCLLGLRV